MPVTRNREYLRNELAAINFLPDHPTIRQIEQWVIDNIDTCWMNTYSAENAVRILQPPYAGHPTTTETLVLALVSAIDELECVTQMDRRMFWHGHYDNLTDVARIIAAPDYPGAFRVPDDVLSRLVIHVAIN